MRIQDDKVGECDVIGGFGGGGPNMFRVHLDVTLYGLKDHQDQINSSLNHKDTRRMDNVEYRCPSMDLDWGVRFTQMKLWNDGNVRTTIFMFGQHSSKRPIKSDTLLVKSF